MPDSLHLIPLDAIDESALSRDRAALDPEELLELQLSIAAHGLRMPIEVYPLPEAWEGRTHGLISGYRRLAAVRNLHEQTQREKYAAIPAFIREPRDLAEALTAMVEENAIRSGLSPWEQGFIAVSARDTGAFASIEEAVEALYVSSTRQKRARLRTIAYLTEELGGLFTAPEQLSLRQCLRLVAAVAHGFGPLIRGALDEAAQSDPESQWRTILPILAEAETRETAEPETASRTPGRPRRMVRIRSGLTVRREMCRDGYLLRFTGREATSSLLDEVIDQIERLYSPC